MPAPPRPTPRRLLIASALAIPQSTHRGTPPVNSPAHAAPPSPPHPSAPLPAYCMTPFSTWTANPSCPFCPPALLPPCPPLPSDGVGGVQQAPSHCAQVRCVCMCMSACVCVCVYVCDCVCSCVRVLGSQKEPRHRISQQSAEEGWPKPSSTEASSTAIPSLRPHFHITVALPPTLQLYLPTTSLLK